MCTDSRLIDKQAQIQAEKIESKSQKKNTEMINEFRIKNSRIEYKNLTEDCWNILCSNVYDLLDTNIYNAEIENRELVFSDDAEKELKKLQNKIEKSYDPELEMYQLSYKTNSGGPSELYIPLETKYTDDITICEVFSKNSEFGVDDIRNIGFPLHKIGSGKLYIDKIPEKQASKVSLYSKKDKNFRQFLLNSRFSPNENSGELIMICLRFITIYILIYLSYIWFNSIVALSVFIFFTIFPLGATIALPVYVGTLFLVTIIIFIDYIIQNNTNRKHEVDVPYDE